MNYRRPYKNKAEEAFCQEAVNRGWLPMKKGWPDFFLQHSEKGVIFVEVKRNKLNHLKREQQLVGRFLKQHGIPVYRWDPQLKKLEDIDAADKRIRSVKKLAGRYQS